MTDEAGKGSGLLSTVFAPALCGLSGCTWLGYLDYGTARQLQEARVRSRSRGERGDELLLCEHQPTLSIGPRTAAGELLLDRAEWERRGVEAVDTDRGGKATYHGPGQLMIYPVVSLRAKRIGVRSFIRQGLEAIAAELCALDLPASVRCDAPGVWLERADGSKSKVAAVGMRIRDGVSDHGFSLSLTGDLTPFSWFLPCGMPGSPVTSLERELGAQWRENLPKSLCRRLARTFLC